MDLKDALFTSMSILNHYTHAIRVETVNRLTDDLKLGISHDDLFNWYRVEGQNRLDEKNRVIESARKKLSDYEIKILGL
jgi:hypothetical protein